MLTRGTSPSLKKQRDLAEKMFPSEWEHSKSMPGVKRRSRQKELRDRASWAEAVKKLVAVGKSCSNCRHWSRFDGTRMQCDIESHFITGTLITAAEHVCPSHDPSL